MVNHGQRYHHELPLLEVSICAAWWPKPSVTSQLLSLGMVLLGADRGGLHGELLSLGWRSFDLRIFDGWILSFRLLLLNFVG